MIAAETVLTYSVGCIVLLFSLFEPLPATADTITELHPRPCVAYHRSRERWGWSWLRPISEDARCDEGYAVFEVDNPGTTRPHWFNCCPLPSPDILTSEHVWAEALCPEGYVVTGLKGIATGATARMLHCTRINTNRYRLGARVPGVPWGIGRSDLLRFQPKKLRKTDVANSIAGSFGRRGIGFWDTNGCTGSPIGSLFVGGSGNDCSMAKFQQLFFKELDSNSDESYPITMYPHCAKRIDLFDPDPKCIE